MPYKFNLSHLSDVRTREDALSFIESLERVKTELFKKDRPDDVLKHEVTAVERQAILHYCEDNKVNKDDPQVLCDLISALQATLDDATHVTMKVSFRPTAAFVETLSEWFVENTGKKVILDLMVDPELIAGTEILVNGVRYDYTFKNAVDTALKEHFTIT